MSRQQPLRTSTNVHGEEDRTIKTKNRANVDQEPGLLATHLSSLFRRQKKKKRKDPRVGRCCLGRRCELSVISTEQESVKTDEPARNDSFIPGLPFHLLRSPSSFPTMVCITTFFMFLYTWLVAFSPFLERTCIVLFGKKIGPKLHRRHNTGHVYRPNENPKL